MEEERKAEFIEGCTGTVSLHLHLGVLREIRQGMGV